MLARQHNPHPPNASKRELLPLHLQQLPQYEAFLYIYTHQSFYVHIFCKTRLKSPQSLEIEIALLSMTFPTRVASSTVLRLSFSARNAHIGPPRRLDVRDMPLSSLQQDLAVSRNGIYRETQAVGFRWPNLKRWNEFRNLTLSILLVQSFAFCRSKPSSKSDWPSVEVIPAEKLDN